MLACANLVSAECTKDKCGYCEYLAAGNFCSTCVGEAISGTATASKCSGGTPIDGCLQYKTDGTTAYCAVCDNSKNYWHFETTAGTATTGTCKLCDRSTKYLNSGTCSAATVVANCDMYQLTVDKCEKCKSTHTITDAATPTCVTAVAGCKKARNAAPTTCVAGEAVAGKHVKADFSVDDNIANCDVAVQTDDTTKAAQCTTCKSGFGGNANPITTCAAITVANCVTNTGTDLAAGCTACKAGFHLKSGTECLANPAGCATAEWVTDKSHCRQCDTAGSYFATDVTSGVTAKVGAAPTFWPQVCTKSAAGTGTGAGSSSQIVAVSVMILAMISNF